MTVEAIKVVSCRQENGGSVTRASCFPACCVGGLEYSTEEFTKSKKGWGPLAAFSDFREMFYLAPDIFTDWWGFGGFHLRGGMKFWWEVWRVEVVPYDGLHPDLWYLSCGHRVRAVEERIVFYCSSIRLKEKVEVDELMARLFAFTFKDSDPHAVIENATEIWRDKWLQTITSVFAAKSVAKGVAQELFEFELS